VNSTCCNTVQSANIFFRILQRYLISCDYIERTITFFLKIYGHETSTIVHKSSVSAKEPPVLLTQENMIHE